MNKSVVALYSHTDRQARHVGTGTLLRIADECFLITAHHVWKKADDSASTLAFYDVGQGVRPILLNGKKALKGAPLDLEARAETPVLEKTAL